MTYFRSIQQLRSHKRQNDATFDYAHDRKTVWTDREIDIVMEDDPDYVALAKLLRRTAYGVKRKRQDVKQELEKELKDLDDSYDGPIIPDTYGEEDEEAKGRYQTALRTACVKLTCSSIRKTEHPTGSEDHQYELMEIYSMMGLME